MVTDIFGQEIKPGCRIVWVGGKTRTAGAKVFKVTNVNKHVSFEVTNEWGLKSYIASTSPNNVVVVDKLMDQK